ncbi:MAG: formate dehydrogenase [Burkholderiaceae bacterium]|nr:formate dehydrogenase [Burkholderiaceae bacterium]
MAESNNKLSRRHWVAGAGTVGTLAAAAAVLPQVLKSPAEPPVASVAPDTSAGYRLSEHVKRYYQTAKV